MIRKVIQQGPSTLMVSLPSKWVKENGIKKGDELSLEDSNNQLVIFKGSVNSNKKAELHVKGSKDYMDRSIMTKYREGISEIYVKYDEASTINLIEDTLRFLMGFEIVDQGKNYCLIKYVSEERVEEYPTMFRRMFQIMVTMSECCLDYANSGNGDSLKTAINMRETLVKLEQSNLRMVNLLNNFSLENKSLEYFYVWSIASFGRMWTSLAKNPLSNNPKFSKAELEFFSEVVSFNREFYELFYKRDRNKMLKMKKRMYELRNIGEDVLNKSNNKLVIFYLMRVLNRIFETTLSFDFD